MFKILSLPSFLNRTC